MICSDPRRCTLAGKKQNIQFLLYSDFSAIVHVGRQKYSTYCSVVTGAPEPFDVTQLTMYGSATLSYPTGGASPETRKA